MSDVEQLSPRWRYGVIGTFALGFAVLILLTFTAYQNAPPIPARVVDTTGAVVFTGEDVRKGQEVFLEYGLMNNGTIWGHGGYLGPDFSATVLHDWRSPWGSSGHGLATRRSTQGCQAKSEVPLAHSLRSRSFR